jgi:hypothetical protein
MPKPCKPCSQNTLTKPSTKPKPKPKSKSKPTTLIKPKKRSFTLIVNEKMETTGRYLSKTPSGVAKKIGNRVLKHHNKNTIKIKIKETTNGSKKQIFHYQVTRVKDPKTVIKDGKEIVFKYKTTVKKINLK